MKSHASRDSHMSRMRFLTDVLQLFKIVAEVACRRVAKPFNLEGHIFRLNIARHVRSGISFNAMMQSFTGNSYHPLTLLYNVLYKQSIDKIKQIKVTWID